MCGWVGICVCVYVLKCVLYIYTIYLLFSVFGGRCMCAYSIVGMSVCGVVV